MTDAAGPDPEHSWFKRILLPGLAVKAFVIGGGYATGRELAEFFLKVGPVGGMLAIACATVVISFLCAVTFVLARRLHAYDYRTFFKRLLGPAWVVFEISYLLLIVLILAVYGAAAGALASAAFGAPEWTGTLALMLLIAGIVALGNSAVERLFRDVSYLLYAVYALFIVLAVSYFGDRIGPNIAANPQTAGWALSGLTYASYNAVGAVIVVPVLRHLVSDRDAVLSGVIAGPLTMLPALLFFIPMIAFYPGVAEAPLPSDFMLGQIGLGWFHLLFQIMIFAALLESGSASLHAVNERIDNAWRARGHGPVSHRARLLFGLVLLGGCMFLAGRFGIVALIANGYRLLAYIFLAVYVVPVATIGLYRVIAGHRDQAALVEERR